MSKEIKQLELINYTVFFVFNNLSKIELNKNDRKKRKILYQLLEKPAELINEQVSALREEFADVDDKGEKIVSQRMGNNVTYQYGKENTDKFNVAYMELLNQSIKVDVLPATQEELSGVADFLENIDLKLNVQDEKILENLVEVLRK
jgi:transcriptional/translational regulatory protein YebC/TACO1